MRLKWGVSQDRLPELRGAELHWQYEVKPDGLGYAQCCIYSATAAVGHLGFGLSIGKSAMAMLS